MQYGFLVHSSVLQLERIKLIVFTYSSTKHLVNVETNEKFYVCFPFFTRITLYFSVDNFPYSSCYTLCIWAYL